MELRSIHSKKAAEMTVGTTIIIILAILVLVFLIFGFSTGWKNFWDKIINLGGGSSNVDTIALACKTACDTNGKNEYCTVNRAVVFADNGSKMNKGSFTCSELSGTVCINSAGSYNGSCPVGKNGSLYSNTVESCNIC
jgi:hypothetical protein